MDPKTLITTLVRLVMKGAWDEAIEAQHQLLEADPKSLRVLQKLGALYQKRDDPLVAAYYLSQAADRQASYGYFIQAAATYKQVLELDPRLPDTHLRLAELYQQLGLMSEALAYFRLVADHAEAVGDVPLAKATLEKMLALEPGNDTLLLELTELEMREPCPPPGGGRGEDGSS